MEGRDERWKAKLDHRLRAQLVQSEDSSVKAAQHVNVLVRFNGNVESLQAYGLAVRSVAGEIAVASLSLADVPKAARAPEILFIELSRPLVLDAVREDTEDSAERTESHGKNQNADA